MTAGHNPLDAWLRALLELGMDRRDYTISEVARRSGLSRQHVSNVLLGVRSPSTEVWVKLLAVVDHDPRDWKV